TLTYTEISGGTVLGTATNDEQVFNAQPIGFNFTFNEIVYQSVSISCNGFLAMGDVVTTSNVALSTGATNNVVAIMNRDLKSRSDGELSYLLEGSIPNRIFTVQWKKYRRMPTQCANDTLNFQIKLYETTNLIQYSYGNCKAANYAIAGPVQVGLRGAANTEFTNRTTTTNWAATNPGASNTANCTMNNTIVPPNGLTFTWTPPLTGVVPQAATSPHPANDVTHISLATFLTWQPGEGNPPTGYKVYFGTDNPPTNIVNGTTQTLPYYDPNPDLTFSTVYYWQIVPYNDIGDAINCPIWTFTAMPNPLVATYPFTENWDEAIPPDVPTNFTVINANNDINTWMVVAAHPNSEPNALRIVYSITEAMDDWFISPPLQMTAGINYQVRFFYKAQSPNYPEKLEVKLGSAPTIDSLTRQIWNDNNMINTAYQEALIPVYPDTSGIYYVGWHAYSNANSYELYVDDIRIETFNPILPPPRNLAGITGNGSVILTWRPPLSRTLLGYTVYRNNIAITPTLVSDTTFTDVTALWGTFYNYTVKATSYIPTGESASSNVVNIMPDYYMPTGLNAITGNGSVVLNWIAPGPLPPQAYNIFKNWAYLCTTVGNITTYVDTTAAIGMNTLYNISAVYSNPVGESEATNPVNITPRFNPPTGLHATATTTAVTLHWTASSPFQPVGYRVFRGTDVMNPTIITDTLFIDITGIPGQNYIYTVKAMYTNPTGISDPSNSVTAAIVGINDPEVPALVTELKGNFPNPFNPETAIDFGLKNDSDVTLIIYNSCGQKIRTLVNAYTKAGNYSITWNGKDNRNRKVASGLYLYKMTSGNYSSTKKMILLK
ncbi:MAG TPA: FlgD immunoglobulin-like domain containing protein, partial [Candidatus Cloacimonadota bacterium]|nr:FlgD immunoglobulin-like domain containing protein [Candidatus Cloacimonadota bacterium]